MNYCALTHTLHRSSTQELPKSDRINVSLLSQIFDNTTNSYKYLYFLSLLEIIRRRQFDTPSPISFQEIVVEMLANAWYPHNYFKLSFGTQDKIANKLESLVLEITEPILKFRDTDKKLLRKAIQAQAVGDIVTFISRYVPFRLIRPFFSQETKGLLDVKVNQIIINLAKDQFETTKPLYCFDREDLKNCQGIILHQDWVDYIAENYLVVRGWASWEWLNYIQQRNPTVPNVVNKLFILQQRDSLVQQTKYWKVILNNQDVECIYSKVKLDKEKISLDHYLPWSFVAHDQLWNLIPTSPSVNSAKSNNIPSRQYFNNFVELQHLGLNVSYQHLSKNQWLKYTETYVAELRISQPVALLRLEIIKKAYEATIIPLISLATIQGFPSNWMYL